MTNEPVLQQWGGIGFNGFRVAPELMNQAVPRFQTGLEVSRDGRAVVTPMVFDDFSGGFLATSSIRPWDRDKNKFWFNTGVETHIPGIAFMAPVLTTDTSLIASDHSGVRAGNRRVHSAMFNRRWFGAVGPNIIKDTSTSDATLTVPATADAVTDDVMSMWVGEFNSIKYLVIGTDGVTDDIRGTVDPTADTITWVELVTQANANDAIYAGAYMETLGTGWNVMIGKNNDVNGIWAVKGTAAVPVTEPTPVVFADTSNIEGNLSATTNSEVSATLSDDGSVGTELWNTSVSADTTYGYKWAYWDSADFSTIPRSAIIVGLQPDITYEESSGNSSITAWADVVVGGSKVGAGIDGFTSSGDTTRSSGGSSDTLGTDLTGDNLRSLGLRIEGRINYGSSSSRWNVTAADIAVTWKMPGTQASLPEGGFTSGAMKSNPTRLPYVAPQSTDKTALTVTRELYFCDFAYDPAGDRPLVSISKPHTGLVYAGTTADFQGGLAVAGGSDESVWDFVKLIDASNRTLDLGFPGVHGTKKLTITQMHSQGNILFVDTACADGSDAQLWMYFNGKWSVAGVQQDMSSAISAEPLLWAETTIGTQNSQGYRLFPVSTTSLAAARQVIRNNMFLDPWLDDAITRHNDTLQNIYLQTVELAAGPPEANTSIATIQFQSRKMDDNTSYGSAGVSVETGGDTSMASPAIAGAGVNDLGKFNDAAEAFVDRNIVTAKDPGVAYDTMIVRFAPGHQAGTTETPSIIPVVFNLVHSWPHLQEYVFVLDPAEQRENLLALRDRMITKSNTKNMQRLLGSGIDEPTVLKNFQIQYKATSGRELPTDHEIESATVTFQRTPGSTT